MKPLINYLEPEAFAKGCRAKGLSVTVQRLAIYKDLCLTDQHPTAEEVYERLRKNIASLSLATVYKTLDILVKHEFITKTRVTGERARYDANRADHHHMVCQSCGMIQDVYNEELNRLSLSQKIRDDFKINSYRIDFLGVCKNCQI